MPKKGKSITTDCPWLFRILDFFTLGQWSWDFESGSDARPFWRNDGAGTNCYFIYVFILASDSNRQQRGRRTRNWVIFLSVLLLHWNISYQLKPFSRSLNFAKNMTLMTMWHACAHYEKLRQIIFKWKLNFSRCSADSITINFNTKNEFQGHVYVKGRYNEDQCRSDEKGKRIAGIKLSFSSCGTKRDRSLNPKGVYVTNTVVISFHAQVSV